MAVIAQSPAGPIEEIGNLKRRQLRPYWRPITDKEGNVTWVETRPLPADVLNKELYLNKGFRLSPPQAEEEVSLQPDPEKEALKAQVVNMTASFDAMSKQAQKFRDEIEELKKTKAIVHRHKGKA